MRRLLSALFVAVIMAACSGVSLPPKAGPEEVQLLNPRMGQAPEDGYKTIGPVRITAPVGTAQNELMRLLLTEAAKLGADAVIFQSSMRSTEGQFNAGVDRPEEMIVTGLAIYWPVTPPPGS